MRRWSRQKGAREVGRTQSHRSPEALLSSLVGAGYKGVHNIVRSTFMYI